MRATRPELEPSITYIHEEEAPRVGGGMGNDGGGRVSLLDIFLCCSWRWAGGGVGWLGEVSMPYDCAKGMDPQRLSSVQ